MAVIKLWKEAFVGAIAIFPDHLGSKSSSIVFGKSVAEYFLLL